MSDIYGVDYIITYNLNPQLCFWAWALIIWPVTSSFIKDQSEQAVFLDVNNYLLNAQDENQVSAAISADKLLRKRWKMPKLKE